MLNIEDIEKRNYEALEKLLKQYNINKTIKDLIDTVSLYVATDKEKSTSDFEVDILKRIRLMCTAKVYDTVDHGEYKEKVFIKTTKEQLYTINNKKIRQLEETNDLSTVVAHLDFICTLVKELQHIESIKNIEDKFKFLNKFDR